MLPEQQQLRSSCPSTSSTTAALIRAAQLGSGNGNNNSSNHVNVYNDGRQTHLTKFAFLLSSARGEGSDEPVVGMHHDVEMAACFSERHLGRNIAINGNNYSAINNNNNGVSGSLKIENCSIFANNNNFNNHWGGNNMMRFTPPSISSSSLSMQSKNGQQQQQLAGMPMKKSALMEIAAMNMSTPFYTTPDTVSSTAKTILKNIVTTMEELMDSRLRSTVSQLVNKSGGIANSQLLFRLLSPSRKPIQVATVITRFVVPDPTDENAAATANMNQSTGEIMLSIPLQFKAILDVKIFGVVSTVELCAPVSMSGQFDPHDGLLTAVDISFDCARLLNTMIQQGRAVVKTAVTKAAALSVQIAEWHARKKASSLMRKEQGLLNNNGATTTAQQSQRSLHSLLGSDVSLSTMGNSLDGGGTLVSMFTSFPSVSHSNNNKGGVPVKPTKGLLRESSRGPWRNGQRNSNEMRSSQKFCNNANATFEFGGGTNSNMNTLARTASRVQFQIPTTLKNSPANTPRMSFSTTNSSSSSMLSQQQAQQQSLQQQQEQEQEELQSADNGNIHQGLFSWLQDDKMFLTEEKIQEQNAADAEAERKLREAPMPLRFFTAAEELGGGESGLQMLSNLIFGQGASTTSSSSQVSQGVKREQHVQGGHCHQKRRT